MTQQDIDYRLYLEERFNGLGTSMNAQFIEVNGRLDGINNHLGNLNGKVAEHEKTILQNLPHSIANCPQAPAIQKIHEAMIEGRGVDIGKAKASTHFQVTFNSIATIISTIVIVATLLYSLKHGDKGRDSIQQSVKDLGTPAIVDSRGDVKPLPAGDSLKFFRDGEFKTGIRDTNGTNSN